MPKLLNIPVKEWRDKVINQIINIINSGGGGGGSSWLDNFFHKNEDNKLTTNELIVDENLESNKLKVKNITASGTTHLNNDLYVQGHEYINGTLTVTTLDVTNSINTTELKLNNIIQNDGNWSIGNGGDAKFNSLTLGGTLNVNGESYFNKGKFSGDVTIDKSLTITGTTRTDGDLKTRSVYPEEDNKKNIGKSGHSYKEGYINTLNTNKITLLNDNLLIYDKNTDIDILNIGIINNPNFKGICTPAILFSNKLCGIWEYEDDKLFFGHIESYDDIINNINVGFYAGTKDDSNFIKIQGYYQNTYIELKTSEYINYDSAIIINGEDDTQIKIGCYTNEDRYNNILLKSKNIYANTTNIKFINDNNDDISIYNQNNILIGLSDVVEINTAFYVEGFTSLKYSNISYMLINDTIDINSKEIYLTSKFGSPNKEANIMMINNNITIRSLNGFIKLSINNTDLTLDETKLQKLINLLSD